MALPSCVQPLASCVNVFFDSDNDLVLEDVVDASGTPITGATVTAEVFDLDDLTTSLFGPVAMSDDGGGDYSVVFTPTAGAGFSVGQRLRIVYDFDGPGADDDRIFNVNALVCEG